MEHTGSSGWRISSDTSAQMLMALYFHDVAGLDGAGFPAVSAAEPWVRRADPRQLTAHVGGPPALRREWEQWWSLLVQDDTGEATVLEPPAFSAFDGSPALQKVMQAHYGAATTWARERRSEYRRLEQEREASGRAKLISQLVQDREMELGRDARQFDLKLIELPLREARAWFVEPNRMILSQKLIDDEAGYRSFVQPVVELLV
ncbi:hypothetical protein D477_014707 [Arthrobacter crystallopoietes BAB-32]|uniref:Uncharacterized protein n=1 Tax=Arthrobacter crystallopoietes BAB-32 TaxID=1246476 RepID=N1V0A4_9MICC|nr:hypothetical protein [Arthrobacter crystallopoietes]EMY33464.1 hypothetical protein D477_014707 [Arthrobacter crystallopoietes BAB-32]